MAASLPGVLNEDVREKVASSKILVVGAGGIGCELLKNLVLTGFINIETVLLSINFKINPLISFVLSVSVSEMVVKISVYFMHCIYFTDHHGYM